jgi:hypothetical protein
VLILWPCGIHFLLGTVTWFGEWKPERNTLTFFRKQQNNFVAIGASEIF